MEDQAMLTPSALLVDLRDLCGRIGDEHRMASVLHHLAADRQSQRTILVRLPELYL
jgi:hypothetical protein